MCKSKICLLAGVTVFITLSSLPAEAWRGGTGVARGARGGSAAWHNGAGVAYGSRGGSAAWNRGAGVAYGPRGGSAAWNRGAGVAYGPNGGSAAWNHRPAYGYGYRPPVAPAYRPVYRPPVYYGGHYGYSSGQVAAAGVAGLAVGTMAGAAIASNNQPANTTVIVQQPATTSLAIGTTLSTLPGSCSVISYNSIQYYQCGTTWIRTFFGNNGAYYQVVSAPY